MSDNPYQTPDSLIHSNDLVKIPGIWWKLYLFFLIFLFSIAFIFELLGIPDTLNNLADIFDWTATFASLLGIYGFIYCKKIFSQKFWKVFFIFIIPWDIYATFKEDFDNTLFEYIVIIFIFVVILGPSYVALYKYSFGRSRAWHHH